MGDAPRHVVDKVMWEVGDLIDGKYEVTAELGRGGMDVVCRVHNREWDLDLAVKMPLGALVSDEASKSRFVREAQTWVDLGLHPNIVQCWYVRELGMWGEMSPLTSGRAGPHFVRARGGPSV